MFSDPIRRLVPVLLLIVSLFSCSVKEDRSGCPSVLTVDLREANKKVPPGFLPFRISVYHSGDLLCDAVTDSSFWQCSVPREDLLVRVAAIKDYNPEKNNLLTESGLLIPDGNDCPSIYWSLYQVGDPGEAETIVPLPRKDFCRLSVSFIGVPPGAIPYDVKFVGNICGYDANMNPLPGQFSFTCREECIVRLPRQKDASLRMDILSGGTTVRSFAIGHYIESCGYDWTTEDLEDLDMEINFAATTITLRSAMWTVVSYFEVMI